MRGSDPSYLLVVVFFVHRVPNYVYMRAKNRKSIHSIRRCCDNDYVRTSNLYIYICPAILGKVLCTQTVCVS